MSKKRKKVKNSDGGGLKAGVTSVAGGLGLGLAVTYVQGVWVWDWLL